MFLLQITKIYNSICVFATKNLCGTQSYNAEKSPADSLCGGLPVLNYYGVIAENVL